MASTIPGRTRRSLAAFAAGLVALALLVFFAVGLPELQGVEAAGSAENPAGALAGTLPDELPGGWTALESSGGPDGGDAEAYDEQQRTAIAYVNEQLGAVYDDGTEFRAYVSEDQQALVTVTAFDAQGGAFAPANGVADPALLGLERAPVELTRSGEAVCISSYQSGAQTGGGADDGSPLSVSCQQPHGAGTLQIGSQGLTLQETVDLLGELDDALGA